MMRESEVKRAMRAYYDQKGFKEVDSREKHEHGWDLVFRHRGGGSYILVEAKGEGKAKAGMENNIIRGLGQIVTRFKQHRNYAHCLALPAGWKRRALKKVPKDALRVLNLRIALVGANRRVEEITFRNYEAHNTDEVRQPRPRPGKQPSLLDMAAEILAKDKKPMNCQTIVARVLASGRWQPKGKTPAATLYSAIIREIAKKGDEARFKKVERGQFALNA